LCDDLLNDEKQVVVDFNVRGDENMVRVGLNSFVAFSVVLAMQLVGQLLSPLAAAAPAASTVDKNYLLEEEPKEAKDVIAVRKDSKDQQDVVLVGRIGGRVNPWVKGMAAFSIVDRTLTPCNEIEGDMCKTPWDYCCETNLSKASLLVTVTDKNGKVVKKDARELLGVKELDTVTLVGKVKRDKAGNVSIMASKLYVAQPKDKGTKKQ
jgi:hypothetical protein